MWGEDRRKKHKGRGLRALWRGGLGEYCELQVSITHRARHVYSTVLNVRRTKPPVRLVYLLERGGVRGLGDHAGQGALGSHPKHRAA